MTSPLRTGKLVRAAAVRLDSPEAHAIPISPSDEARALIRCSEVVVRSLTGGYPVRIGDGARRLLPAAVAAAAPSGRCALISDERVAGLWYDRVAEPLQREGMDVVPVFFRQGEANKTRAVWARLTDDLIIAGLGRDCCVVSLGGGVVGDMAGFVAATFMRGVPFIQVPTTTLAMIDASVGGKTGVDHAVGKNLIGAFYSPCEVLADPAFLTTLDRGQRAEGYAEAVKHGVILDAEYAQWLATNADTLLDGDPEAVERAVVRSVRIKAEVVSGDLLEAGRRKILNFGHTVAHALELDSGYTLPHGHAVSVGMVAEARIGEALGITARGTAEAIRGLVAAFGLPDRHRSLGRAGRLARMMVRDKKTRSGIVHMVRLESLGRTSVGDSTTVPIPEAELISTLKRLFR